MQLIIEAWIEKSKAPPDGGSSPSEAVEPTCGFCEEKVATRRCIQCDGVLCHGCEQSLHSKGIFKSHSVVDLDSSGSKGADDVYGRRMICGEHADEKLSFYCDDCQKPVCPRCLILGSHKGHQQQPIDQASSTGKSSLTQWEERLRQHAQTAEELLDRLRGVELEVQNGAEAQRNGVNSELDQLKELIETRRHQLLSKSALEEKQKRVTLQAQMDRADAVSRDTTGLVSRASNLLDVRSPHPFLAVLLPLIQDMKKCASQPIETSVSVSSAFRPLSTDAQVRALGDLDLGHPRAQPAAAAAEPRVQMQVCGGAVAANLLSQTQQHGSYSMSMAGYGATHAATMSYMAPHQPPQLQQPPQVQVSQQGMRGAGGGVVPTVVYYHSVHGA